MVLHNKILWYKKILAEMNTEDNVAINNNTHIFAIIPNENVDGLINFIEQIDTFVSTYDMLDKRIKELVHNKA